MSRGQGTSKLQASCSKLQGGVVIHPVPEQAVLPPAERDAEGVRGVPQGALLVGQVLLVKPGVVAHPPGPGAVVEEDVLLPLGVQLSVERPIFETSDPFEFPKECTALKAAPSSVAEEKTRLGGGAASAAELRTTRERTVRGILLPAGD